MIEVRSSSHYKHLKEFCPTVREPELTTDFLKFWNEVVNRPWLPGQANVPGVFGLNLEVFRLASGQDVQTIRTTALANMARCRARWLEIPTDQEWEAIEQQHPEEVPWLEFLINRRQANPRSLIKSWHPRHESWQWVKNSLNWVFKSAKTIRYETARLTDPSNRVSPTVKDVCLESFALHMLDRGHWRKLSEALEQDDDLFASSFRLAALLCDKGLSEVKTREIQTNLQDRLYYLGRLQNRFKIRRWDRATTHQEKMVEICGQNLRVAF